MGLYPCCTDLVANTLAGLIHKFWQHNPYNMRTLQRLVGEKLMQEYLAYTIQDWRLDACTIWIGCRSLQTYLNFYSHCSKEVVDIIADQTK